MKKSVIIGIVIGLIVIVAGFFLFNNSSSLFKTSEDLSESGTGFQESVGEETPEEVEEILNASPESERITEGCSREFSPTLSTGPYYTGPLFDAHFHMPNLIDFSALEGLDAELAKGHAVDRDVLLDSILCRFNEENVRGAIGFTIGAEELLEETLQTAKSFKQKSLGKINLFLMPQVFSIDNLENIAVSNEGLFEGYGEIAFYYGEQKNQNPDDKEFLDIYEMAGKHNLIVMMHPDTQQESNVENAVRQNPNVKFLLHGWEIENSVTNILSKYPNTYYSIDAILIRLPRSGPPLYTTNNKEEFKLKFTQDYDTMLNNAVNDWKSKIEQYPDRFMWGTDRGDEWHYDEEVSVLLEEFARDFIAKLDPSVQEKFAYKNAEKLLE